MGQRWAAGRSYYRANYLPSSYNQLESWWCTLVWSGPHITHNNSGIENERVEITIVTWEGMEGVCLVFPKFLPTGPYRHRNGIVLKV